MAWRKHAETLPARLREFREADWPPVPGECLGHYACRGEGYDRDCVPRPGEQCWQACYDRLAADYAPRPEVLAAAKRADAYTRFSQARLDWFGEFSDGWLTEFLDGMGIDDAIRYAPFRDRA